MGDPVAEDDEMRILVRNFPVHQDVTMAEDEEIDVSYITLREEHQMFLVVTKVVGELVAIEATLLAPPMRKACGKIGMYELAVHHLDERTVEESAHQLVAEVVVTQAIAMSQEQALAIALKDLGMMVDLNAQLIVQVSEQPDVVITREPMHADTTIRHSRYLSEETHKTLRHNLAILEPVVDDVAHQEQLLAITLDGLEEAHKSPLVLQRVAHRTCSKMAIAQEIDHRNPSSSFASSVIIS